jgi:hypothetical protein
VLCGARATAQTGPIGPSRNDNGRAQLRQASVFLAGLADYGRHLDDLDQAGPPGHPPEQPVGPRPPSQVLRRDNGHRRIV